MLAASLADLKRRLRVQLVILYPTYAAASRPPRPWAPGFVLLESVLGNRPPCAGTNYCGALQPRPRL